MENKAKNVLIKLKKLKQRQLKASKKAIEKITEATGNLIGNKIANQITKVSKSSPLNNLEKENIGDDKEMLKERYISPEKRQQIIHDLTLI